ncbi:MAG: hypothetical protein FGM15_09385 [Chthoniobacterales bacterium]|nr:hypothetical protein [Chthoniobacterales bacterium]
MRTGKKTLLPLALLLCGCAGMDLGSDTGGPRTAAGSGLNSEQRTQLRQAAKSGEHELVATVGRMAWDDPSDAIELGNYAASLNPDCTDQITAAVTRAVQR